MDQTSDIQVNLDKVGQLIFARVGGSTLKILIMGSKSDTFWCSNGTKSEETTKIEDFWQKCSNMVFFKLISSRQWIFFSLQLKKTFRFIVFALWLSPK